MAEQEYHLSVGKLEDEQGWLPKEVSLKPDEVETLRRSFEERWEKDLSAKITVENPDGSRTIHETYELEITQPRIEQGSTIRDFCTGASLLGYSSSIGPVVMAETTSGTTTHYVSFFLERTLRDA